MVQERSIFIGGLPRSGTSLMRAIVGSHPKVAIFDNDLQLWAHYYDAYKDKDLNEPETLNRFIHSIFADRKFKAAKININREAFQRELKKENELDCGLVFKKILQTYAAERQKPIWGLKTPYNEFYSEQILKSYPEAKMIHMIRDPRDVLLSYKNSYAREGLNLYKHATEWKHSVALARDFSKLYKNRYMPVQYEDLVAEPQHTSQKVWEFLDLDYNPSILNIGGHPGWDQHNSSFDDFDPGGDVIFQASIGRYRTQLPVDEIWLYQHWLSSDLQFWGYEVQGVQLSVRDLGKVGYWLVFPFINNLLSVAKSLSQ